jgi:hypothetical protein
MATLELPVKWQGRTFSVVLPADADVSELKRQLESETRVQARACAPPTHVRAVGPCRRRAATHASSCAAAGSCMPLRARWRHACAAHAPRC